MTALVAALTIAAPIAIASWIALRTTRPRARHAAQTRADMLARAWAEAWRPGPGDHATALRLRRDLRRWIPRKRLP